MSPTAAALSTAMDVDTARKYLSAEATPFLREGIGLTLYRWSALQMAVDNEWGGRNSRVKANLLVEEIFSWFMNSKELYIDDLETLLEEFMIFMNTVIDDGSIEEIAENLMLMHEEFLEGNYSSVESLRRKPRVPAGSHIRQALNDEEDDGKDDDDEDRQGDTCALKMTVDATISIPNTKPPTLPVDKPSTSKSVEAEEGWTTVSSSRRKKAGRKPAF
ncbi:hypothetical protein QQ045_022835 [Rhodiola kirilowii]